MRKHSIRPELEHDLTARERQVLEAVVRTYVDTAEPAGSRVVSRRFDLGVSAATVRNTMSDLEEKGYLFHPHTSAGRIPTDLAYRFFVNQLIHPERLSETQRNRLLNELESVPVGPVQQMVGRAVRALSVLSYELGLAIAPHLDDAFLEKLDLIQVSTDKVLLVATIRSGFVRTVYMDLPGEVPQDTLSTLASILNERLAGLSLAQIRATLPERLQDSVPGDEATEELLNIFMQSGADLFDWSRLDESEIHLGKTSVLAAQPEFTKGARLKELIELTERRDLLAGVLDARRRTGGLQITIGGENDSEELSDFTLVTAEYRAGGLKGVIGVIGPTRMPYEKVIAIVDHTSRHVTDLLTR